MLDAAFRTEQFSTPCPCCGVSRHWTCLIPCGVQHFDQGYPSLELRNCPCGSTIARELPGSGFETLRPVPTGNAGGPSAAHVAQLNTMVARAAKREADAAQTRVAREKRLRGIVVQLRQVSA